MGNKAEARRDLSIVYGLHFGINIWRLDNSSRANSWSIPPMEGRCYLGPSCGGLVSCRTEKGKECVRYIRSASKIFGIPPLYE